MNIPIYIRAKLTASGDGKVTDVAIEEVQQVIRFVDGYPSPPQLEKVRDLTEEEVKSLNISFTSKTGDRESEEKAGLEAMWKVIRELAKNDTAFPRYWGSYECPFCHVIYDSLDNFQHDETCIVTRARVLVAEIDKGKE